MGKITRIEALAVSIPVARPTRISTRVLAKRDFLIVTVQEEGSDEVGVGYAYAGTSGARICRAIVDELLTPTALGALAEDIAGLYERLYQETLLLGRRGAVIRAISALDIALWDLAGKRAQLPLCVLLGGALSPVPAYASGGYYRDEEISPEEAVSREIAADEAAGFSDHKIKVGGLSVAADAARVKAAANAMGDGSRLAVDANNAYSTVAEALAATHAFEEATGGRGLWWMEEPLSPDDVNGHAELCHLLETPIATGEIAQTRHDFRALVETRAADVLQPDAGVVGGVTEWMRVARTAELFGIPIAPHWHANVHVHLAAASTNCLGVEHFDLEKDIYNFEQLVLPAARLRPIGGAIVPSSRPGIGVELDPDAIERYSLA